jgi:hypothetical protein
MRFIPSEISKHVLDAVAEKITKIIFAYFADATTAASFAIEFMGTHRTQSKALAATARAVRACLPTKH